VLRAVLFDLDGTLMDHDAAREAGLRAHLEDWLPGTEAAELERLAAEWRRLEARHYDEYARGDCSFSEQRRRRVAGMHAVLEREPAQELAADDWFAAYLSHYRRRWRAFEDAAPALSALAAAHPQARLGVVTNGEGEPQRAKLAAIGLEDRFEVVVASGEEGVAKPRAEIFELACERLGARAGQAAHVGDRLDLDAEGAAAAGLRGVWLDRVGQERGPGHVARITTLRELPAALE
jgi:putative hydrolase of the HAD superfamily